MKFFIPLEGPAGEPVDLWRTINSHGVASLPPLSIDEERKTLTATLRMPRGKPRTVIVGQGPGNTASIEVIGPAANEARIVGALRHVLAMDRDLSSFYKLIANDRDLSWAASGAGRMIRSQTVFEEVIKTVCTTNCAWSATKRMVGALVSDLGEAAPGGAKAFPTPQAMADAEEKWYREVARAGYRGAYLRSLASSVAEGSIDLEALDTSNDSEDVLFKKLLELPGVGPYAAAHILTMIGRHSRPILDSWSRPKYAKLVGRKSVSDKAIIKRFSRYGDHAGLAFWLFVTRDWG
ncbi:MAG: DNA-3-methyladenine glycosylase family protein [Actinomycetota bacterium]